MDQQAIDYWSALAERLALNAKGSTLRVPTTAPHPERAGFTRSSLGTPRGQLADWRVRLLDGSGLHALEFTDRWELHHDQVHPDGIASGLAHLARDLLSLW